MGRSDYGIYRPILRKIVVEPDLRLQLIVSGAHLASEFGRTVDQIEADGFSISDAVHMQADSDTPEAISRSMGIATAGFAASFARNRPDLLIVLGDRFEMHAAAVAAVPFTIPMAHIHGGEITEGAIDDAFRHSITKLSHLHFVSTEVYARRLQQMGEEPWRVTISGAPGLDNIREIELLGSEELSRQFSIRLDTPPLLITFHPATLEHEQTQRQTSQLLDALREVGLPAIFTLPNADTSSRAIMRMIQEFVSKQRQASLVENFGTRAYFSLLAACKAMVGNSSSGIIEAASFRLPVVNIGTRQNGRLRPKNVIDVGNNSDAIAAAIRRAVSEEFRAGLRDLTNPYGTGNAAPIIVDRLKNVPIDDRLIRKKFVDA